MKNMLHIASGIDVMPLVLTIQRNPQLWNQNTQRTQPPGSPHHGLSDIWVRYSEGDPDPVKEHDSVWYPAYQELPQVREIIFNLMRYVEGERLGGILITKIPPGKACLPHVDTGGWHAGYYDKYAIQLQGNAQQAFCFNGEKFSARPGDIYWFNNQEEHWVTNESQEDRMTMIVCIRSARHKNGGVPCLG